MTPDIHPIIPEGRSSESFFSDEILHNRSPEQRRLIEKTLPGIFIGLSAVSLSVALASNSGGLEKVLAEADCNALNSWIKSNFINREVRVIDPETEDIVKVELGNIIPPHLLRYVTLFGLYSLIKIREQKGIGAEEFEDAKQIIIEEIANLIKPMSPEAICAFFDNNPTLQDLSQVPLDDKNGKPIESISDWIRSWLKEAMESGENAMQYLRRLFGEQLPQAELLMLMAQEGLESVKLLSPHSGKLDQQYDDERSMVCADYLRFIISGSNFETNLGILLATLEGSIQGEGIFSTKVDLMDEIMEKIALMIEKGKEENG